MGSQARVKPAPVRSIQDARLSARLQPANLFKLIQILEIDTTSAESLANSLPFAPGDTTAGAENEYQTAVAGEREHVDLPSTVEASNYFKNLKKRALRGDTSASAVKDLERFFEENTEGIWENSWVRFPRKALNPFAEEVLRHDLRSDKRQPHSPQRKDARCFSTFVNGEQHLRLPVSYLLKLALADAVGNPATPDLIKACGREAMNHFLSDNTSPETFSFYPAAMEGRHGDGQDVARETALRFLLSQLLLQYANEQFGLLEHDQRAMLYFAPHPPVRQNVLNNLISDSFYRSLFMSPCLSGWDVGEEKHRYMHLCHKVLSRSQLNAVIKLREAGIITNNLVVLPNTSNISLANNGTHISLGSRKLTRLMAETGSGFGAVEEKYYSDLVIKIVEHFLPLFVGIYTAAPYRIDYRDFHPERVLGFLPHELDYTHLRMLWRRWKKKADLNILGRSVTPFGPEWLDRTLSRGFGLKGDFVPDFRLIDYLVALMGTAESPALDGALGNDLRLKRDLSDLGVFDADMPLYMLYRGRVFETMGFTGFEGRHYSLFEDLVLDMGAAANLQMLVTALAYKYILTGEVTHADIPDDPFVESERRQIFFGTAIGIPTFYVKTATRNKLLARLVYRTDQTRPSRRYTGYTRVLISEFQKTLVAILTEDAPELIEQGGLRYTLKDLEYRLRPEGKTTASQRLTRRICDLAGAKSPLSLNSREFNAAAESFYRGRLKAEHMQQALDLWQAQARDLDSMQTWREGYYNQALFSLLAGNDAAAFIDAVRDDLMAERLPASTLTQLIHLLLLTLDQMKHQTQTAPNEP
jgi:hypothetical protein